MAQVLSWEEKPATAARRSAFEVRMDILKAVADGPAKPTHVMYRSNTSWMILQRNFAALLAAGFIKEEGEDTRVEYVITERGAAVLHDYLDLVRKATAGPTEVRA
jgi:predicted transcriptional regulator